MENLENSQTHLEKLFAGFQLHIDAEQQIREEIKVITRQIDTVVKTTITTLQVIHSNLEGISAACLKARQNFEECRRLYAQLASLVPVGRYYRYCDQWHFLTQRCVFLIALTVFLETGRLVNREDAADILGMKVQQQDGFHLDVEDYLMGLLQMVSELSRFATNSVTLGDFSRPLRISHFVADLHAGFRLLNLKNDGLRKRFDGLKYDVKKIEEVVYDVSLRGLHRPATAAAADAAPVSGAAADAAETG